MDFNAAIKENNFRYKKQLGQNFLSGTNLLSAIAADCGATPDDLVLEVGTGAGALTRALAVVCKKVISFEIDTDLKPIQEKTLSDLSNVEVVYSDVLKMSDGELSAITNNEPFKVCANIPYYITAPLILRFINSSLSVKSITVTVQKEVASKLTAAPGDPDYGSLTVFARLKGTVTKTRDISRKAFFPVPDVDSSVVRIELDRTDLSAEEFKKVNNTVKIAFQNRRKTLKNNLESLSKGGKNGVSAALAAMGKSDTARAEELLPDEFIKLTQLL
ncbi:MAG: 16S rRNA (adenine(1518)-N(6)/adenine(1519)-N(6))-dimethyltransferase RsmA [Christensenellaceae bacterium]|jgi:16S rRNA (adenine1518-N6/adenine1519-N6)-dimethyltransferase|nr:16S rRNA (adenine(1518)-N(6)/adenine(1519)-N(6))-dimethyltransferase RsmA [Christensenellaceae bacterium]